VHFLRGWKWVRDHYLAIFSRMAALCDWAPVGGAAAALLASADLTAPSLLGAFKLWHFRGVKDNDFSFISLRMASKMGSCKDKY